MKLLCHSILVLGSLVGTTACSGAYDDQADGPKDPDSMVASQLFEETVKPKKSDCESAAVTLCRSARRCSGVGACNLNQTREGQELQFGIAAATCEQTLSSRLCSSSRSQLETCRAALFDLSCEQEGEWRAVRVHSACAIGG